MFNFPPHLFLSRIAFLKFFLIFERFYNVSEMFCIVCYVIGDGQQQQQQQQRPFNGL